MITQDRRKDWRRLRDVRLRALAGDPDAFLETYEQASTIPRPVARARDADRRAGVLRLRGRRPVRRARQLLRRRRSRDGVSRRDVGGAGAARDRRCARARRVGAAVGAGSSAPRASASRSRPTIRARRGSTRSAASSRRATRRRSRTRRTPATASTCTSSDDGALGRARQRLPRDGGAARRRARARARSATPTASSR